MRTSTNSTGPEVNDHVSLQWPSYEQPHGSNLRPQREQTSWSQTLTIRPLPRWLPFSFLISGVRAYNLKMTMLAIILLNIMYETNIYIYVCKYKIYHEYSLRIKCINVFVKFLYNTEYCHNNYSFISHLIE